MRDLSPSASFVFENGINEVYPTGIPLDFFDFRLSYAKETIDPDKCGLPLPPETIDVFLNYQRYLVHCREYGHDPLNIPKNISYISHRAIPWHLLNENDLFRLRQCTVISNPIHDKLSHDPTIMPVWKVSNSMWRNGYNDEYNQFVDHANKMLDFDPILPPDFSVKLDVATYCNERGYSLLNRKYLDGTHAYIIHYKNKPVYIVGFSFRNNQVILEQLQATSTHGNRWMYKLPQPAHFFFTELMIKHFTNLVVRNSESRKARWISGYGKYPKPHQDVIDRVNDMYDAIQDRYTKKRWFTTDDFIVLKMPKGALVNSR